MRTCVVFWRNASRQSKLPVQVFQNSWTVLHHTARAGHIKVVKVLMETGASPTAVTKEGKVPLCYAASAQKIDVLTYLILKDHDCFQLLEDKAFLFDLMNCGRVFHQKALEDFITTSPSPVETALKLSRFYKDQSLKEKELERDLGLASTFCETLGNDLLTISCNRFNPAMVLRAIDQYDKSLMDILIDGSHKGAVRYGRTNLVVHNSTELDWQKSLSGPLPLIHIHTGQFEGDND